MKRFICVFAGMVLLISSSQIRANADETLMDLIHDGPIAQVFYDENNQFQKATGFIYIKRSRDQVWQTMTDFEHYIEFAPRVKKFNVMKREKNTVEADVRIDNPGPDTHYEIRYTLEKENYLMNAEILSGNVSGTGYVYTITNFGEGSLLRYSCNTKLPKILTAVEGPDQAMTIGINVSTALAIVQSIKKRAEEATK